MKAKLSLVSKALFLASLGAVLVTPIFAQQNQQNSSFGIEVSAPLYQFSLKPGSVQQDIVKVRNVGSSTQTYFPLIRDFKAKDTSGAPEFIDPKVENTTYSLAKWISFTNEKITIEPGESAAFNFVISVPADAEPGGHYGAILFSTEPVQIQGSGAGLVSQVGSLILVRVSGNVKESAKIKEFKSDKGSYDRADVQFTTLVENTGNVHIQPKGTIEIKNLFGSTIATADVNSLSANVLPDSSRKFSSVWKDPGFKFGYYTASLTLTFGDPAQTISAQTTFWIVPWKTLLVALLILIAVLIVLYFAIKKYNSWIISRATKKSQPQD